MMHCSTLWPFKIQPEFLFLECLRLPVPLDSYHAIQDEYNHCSLKVKNCCEEKSLLSQKVASILRQFRVQEGKKAIEVEKTAKKLIRNANIKVRNRRVFSDKLQKCLELLES
jgi:hypothetical protein